MERVSAPPNHRKSWWMATEATTPIRSRSGVAALGLKVGIGGLI
jgi:hypothetical protein